MKIQSNRSHIGIETRSLSPLSLEMNLIPGRRRPTLLGRHGIVILVSPQCIAYSHVESWSIREQLSHRRAPGRKSLATSFLFYYEEVRPSRYWDPLYWEIFGSGV